MIFFTAVLYNEDLFHLKFGINPYPISSLCVHVTERAEF